MVHVRVGCSTQPLADVTWLTQKTGGGRPAPHGSQPDDRGSRLSTDLPCSVLITPSSLTTTTARFSVVPRSSLYLDPSHYGL